MAYSCVLVHTWWTIHLFNVMLVCTWTAFSHTKGDVSSKKEDRFHCWSYMVELAKARPKLKGLIFVTLFVSEEVCVCHTRDVYEVIDCFQRSVEKICGSPLIENCHWPSSWLQYSSYYSVVCVMLICYAKLVACNTMVLCGSWHSLYTVEMY